MGQALLIGFISSVALSLAGLIARILAVGPFPAEKLYNTVTFWLGTPEMFQLVHKIFGFGQGGKIAAFGGVLLGWLGGLTLLGLLPVLPASAIVFVVSSVILLPSSGVLGLVWGAIYGLIYWLVRRAVAPVADDVERRSTLRVLGFGAAGLVGVGAAGVLAPLFRSGGRSSAASSSAAVTNGKLPVGITPTEDFYYVSISNEALDPRIKETDWKLDVGGMVRTPSKFSLSELRSDFAAQDVEWTLACISNPIGGDLNGNAIWRGFKAKDLFERVGVQPGAKWVLWEAADGFFESIPLAEVLDEDCVLVYDMNGAPLNSKHGFPLRVLIPGRYGMKMPRWIAKITLSSEEKPGYWANRGWSKTAYIQPTSRFDFPKDGDSFKPNDAVELRGVAYAGLKKVTKVEVSVDDGPWLEAKLTPPRAKFAWTIWSLPWNAIKGASSLKVRCVADGVVQSAEDRDSLPEAASGLHRVIINVA